LIQKAWTRKTDAQIPPEGFLTEDAHKGVSARGGRAESGAATKLLRNNVGINFRRGVEKNKKETVAANCSFCRISFREDALGKLACMLGLASLRDLIRVAWNSFSKVPPFGSDRPRLSENALSRSKSPRAARKRVFGRSGKRLQQPRLRNVFHRVVNRQGRTWRDDFAFLRGLPRRQRELYRQAQRAHNRTLETEPPVSPASSPSPLLQVFRRVQVI